MLFHKPLDSLSITSVMAVEQWSRRARDVVNLLFSLICPSARCSSTSAPANWVRPAHCRRLCVRLLGRRVPCISLADILPEIQFHHHDRVKLSAALLIGVALSFAIGLFEPSHAHSDREAATHGEVEHVH